MGLNRYDVIKKINIYSAENNKKELIDLLCQILDDSDFKNENIDLVHIIISLGELYGYYSYFENELSDYIDESDLIRKSMYRSYDSSIYYNSGQLSLLTEISNYQKVFISAPTSFGKTKLVLEYISSNRDLSNILFIVPTNSLSEEIYIKLLNFNLSIDNKYHISTNPKFEGRRNILILTPEKYLLLLESRDPDFDLYIMDESYKIEDEQDNSITEDPLNSRSSKFRRIMEYIARKDKKVIYLSPYTYLANDSMIRFFNKYNIKKIDRTENYVNKKLYRIESSNDYKTTLNENIVGFQKGLSGVKKASYIINDLEYNTIIYVRYPNEALDFINATNNHFNLDETSDRFKDFIKHIQNNYEFDDSNWYILDGLKKGIGVYVSPIPRYIKREIINLFNDGELQYLVVTSAFAEGVNSSAKNIIITNDIVGSNIPMTPLDLLNLSGRAGRFGIHSQGNIYTVKNEVYTRIKNCMDSGVHISNLNYECSNPNSIRNIYDIEMIDDEYLNVDEIAIKEELSRIQNELDVSDDDLNVALSISKLDKIRLYKHFISLDNEEIEIRKNIINNILSEEKNEIINSMDFIFKELVSIGIKIVTDRGNIPAFSKNNESFLWGKFYGIHSSGNIKEVLKNRREYIQREYNKLKNKIDISDSWINEFISDGRVDNFKLYNQAFKFISNIIEYRIPFYIGFYISIFKVYCKKTELAEVIDYDVVEISNSLENKKLEDKYNKLLEYGFSLDMIKKIKDGNDTNDLLDDYEKRIYNEYLQLVVE